MPLFLYKGDGEGRILGRGFRSVNEAVHFLQARYNIVAGQVAENQVGFLIMTDEPHPALFVLVKEDQVERPKHHAWVCSKCGHLVVSPRKPKPIHWTDGHVCRFVKGPIQEEEDNQ